MSKQIYCDGACAPNPGEMGIGALNCFLAGVVMSAIISFLAGIILLVVGRLGADDYPQ